MSTRLAELRIHYHSLNSLIYLAHVDYPKTGPNVRSNNMHDKLFQKIDLLDFHSTGEQQLNQNTS